MKHIFLNLKRFDIPKEYGGINTLAKMKDWGACIVEETQKYLSGYSAEETEFIHFLPEAHLLHAVGALTGDTILQIGCQGVYRADTAQGGNFGAFTSNRTANAVRAMGCKAALIGHCEERKDKKELLLRAKAEDMSLVDTLLNEEIKCAQAAGLKILYCIGEAENEMEHWKEVLGGQLERGLMGTDRSQVVIGYEPVWSIGPGKEPAGKEYITMIARFVKEYTGGMDVVYGGGLKSDNAQMLSSIKEIDGGLIALTRFTGEIGFYPEEYAQIVRLYLGK